LSEVAEPIEILVTTSSNLENTYLAPIPSYNVSARFLHRVEQAVPEHLLIYGAKPFATDPNMASLLQTLTLESTSESAGKLPEGNVAKETSSQKLLPADAKPCM
jgi:hypothetical protein